MIIYFENYLLSIREILISPPGRYENILVRSYFRIYSPLPFLTELTNRIHLLDRIVNIAMYDLYNIYN